jgi:hypothetical protein
MKMSQLKMAIREVVREEIRIGLREIIGELKQPTIKKSKPKQKTNYSKNPILNEVLKETAENDWETLGGETFTSNKMGDILGKSYGDMMNTEDTVNANGNLVREMGMDPNDPTAAFLKKDYRELMNAVDKKQGK